MNIIGIIPARMESSRLPGKPLMKILGIPMLGHVFYRSKMSKVINELYVATCNEEIANYIESINGNVVMTSNKHERASDRTAEALYKIEKQLNKKFDIVIMLQGDEPMITSDMIDSAVKPLINDSEISVSNLMVRIENSLEFNDPNEVKVVIDKDNYALYFSREPIPSNKKYNGEINAYKQVCVIPFKRNILIEYTDLKPTPLEIIESVDMNRLLENGYKVKMIETEFQTLAVDTIKDLKTVNKKMLNDNLIKHYL
tara:strand:+ start:160 stop:927 length:768 start_codon:yes stop_codon:yes gene_type:complete